MDLGDRNSMQNRAVENETPPLDKTRSAGGFQGRYEAERGGVGAPSSADSPLEDELRDVVRAMWRRKFWIATPIVLVMGATFATLPFVPLRYTVTYPTLRTYGVTVTVRFGGLAGG